MHQVFTVPSMREEPKWLLKNAAKLVYLLPVGVFSFGFVYDGYTVVFLKLFSLKENWKLLATELVFLALIIWLSWTCKNRQTRY
jgi:hypothetical protein